MKRWFTICDECGVVSVAWKSNDVYAAHNASAGHLIRNPDHETTKERREVGE